MLVSLLLVATLLFVSPVLADNVEFADILRIHEQNQEYDLAIKGYSERLSELESELGPYANELIDPLFGLARSYKALSEYTAAIAVLERAQHLSHRQDGVYAMRQLEGTDLLIEILIARREVELADRQQHFALFIAEHNVGADTIDILPALDKMSQWYIETRQFNRAKVSLARSREIVTTEAGEFDPLQLASIMQTARIKRLQPLCCSYKVLLEALEILENSDTSDETRVQVYLELADSYTLANIKDKAAKYYRLAWQTMQSDTRIGRFAVPQKITLSNRLTSRQPANFQVFRPAKNSLGRQQFEPLSERERREQASLPPQEFSLLENENDFYMRIRDRHAGNTEDNEKTTRVIGYPFQFIHRQLLNILPKRLRSDARLSQLKIELDFTVDPGGQVHDVEVRSPIAPYKLTRLMRKALLKSRFRPRLENGEPVKTTHVKLYQSFNS